MHGRHDGCHAEFGGSSGDLAEQIQVSFPLEVFRLQRLSRVLNCPRRFHSCSAESADLAQLGSLSVEHDVGPGGPQGLYEFPLEARLGRIDGHRACREVSPGMEILEPPAGGLTSVDCMTVGSAERTGEQEQDDFRHVATPSTFLLQNM